MLINKCDEAQDEMMWQRQRKVLRRFSLGRVAVKYDLYLIVHYNEAVIASGMHFFPRVSGEHIFRHLFSLCEQFDVLFAN